MAETIHPQKEVRFFVLQLATSENCGYCSSCILQWGWGESESELLSQFDCFDTCRIAYIRSAWRRRGGIAGGKGRRQAVLTVFAGEREGRVHQGLQCLSGGKRPFRLCNDLLFARRRPLHHMRLVTERTVAEGRGRVGTTVLPGRFEQVEGQDRQWRLRNRRLEVAHGSSADSLTVCAVRPPLSCRISPPQGGRSPVAGINARHPSLKVGENHTRVQSPPLRGRYPAGQRGVFRNLLVGSTPVWDAEAPSSARS